MMKIRYEVGHTRNPALVRKIYIIFITSFARKDWIKPNIHSQYFVATELLKKPAYQTLPSKYLEL